MLYVCENSSISWFDNLFYDILSHYYLVQRSGRKLRVYKSTVLLFEFLNMNAICLYVFRACWNKDTRLNST